MEKIRNKRALKNEDIDRLSQNLLGIPFIDIKKELKNIENGQLNNIDSLVDKASIKNGLEPEDLKRLLEQILMK